MSRILVLINPKSRSGAAARESICETLSKHNHSITIPEDDGSDCNEYLLKHHASFDYILVGGGDGSVNYVLPSLVKTQIPVIVYPLGTANNFARTYGLTAEMDDLLKLIEDGKVVEVDLGIVNDIYFLSVAGLGLSTEVNLKVSSWLKRHLGVFAFILTAFQMMFKMNPFRAWIRKDKEDEVRSKSWQISVCNGKYYGSGLTIKHNATLDDGKLHLLSTEVKSIWNGFVLIPSFMTGKYKKDQDITLFSAKEIHIKTRRVFKIDVDGDIKTTTPATFSLAPKSLKVLVPVN